MNKRVLRRQALRSSVGLAAASSFLIACGGDDDEPQASSGGTQGSSSGASTPSGGSGSTPAESSSLVTRPEDTSSNAKQAGRFIWAYTRDPLHFDSAKQGQAQLGVFDSLVRAPLVRNAPGFMEPSSYSEILSNTAESWELSPDKLTLTLKLRSDAKWHDIPPVNGRNVIAEDVEASWQRYIAQEANNRAAHANSLNPSAPIVSVTAVDATTVQIKLASPASYLMLRLASTSSGELGVGLSYPMEAGSEYDPGEVPIGNGGFVWESYEPSVGATYVRNPDYWDDKEPHFAEFEFVNLPEYAAQLSQFHAGALLTLDSILASDLLPTKKAVEGINLYENLLADSNPLHMIGFGWNDFNGEPSPFLDERVRQAMSLAINRDEYLEAAGEVAKFAAEGIDIKTFYFTSVGYLPEWTLDPRDTSTFGPNATYYRYDPDEAKKLLQAAAYNTSLEFPSHQVQGLFGAGYTQDVEILQNYAREVGFKPQANPIEYSEYLQKIVTQGGGFEGWAHRIGGTTSEDVVDYFLWRYWSKSGVTSGNLGFGPDFALGADSVVDDLLDKAKSEFDSEVQIGLIHDVQRHLAAKQYGVTRPGITTSFKMAWEALGNYQVFRQDSRSVERGFYTWWIDDTKKPLA